MQRKYKGPLRSWSFVLSFIKISYFISLENKKKQMFVLNISDKIIIISLYIDFRSLYKYHRYAW